MSLFGICCEVDHERQAQIDLGEFLCCCSLELLDCCVDKDTELCCCCDKDDCCMNDKENNGQSDTEPILEQPRFEPNSSPINHNRHGRSGGGNLVTSGHLGTTSNGTCSAAKDSSDHTSSPPTYDQATSEYCSTK